MCGLISVHSMWNGWQKPPTLRCWSVQFKCAHFLFGKLETIFTLFWSVFQHVRSDTCSCMFVMHYLNACTFCTFCWYTMFIMNVHKSSSWISREVVHWGDMSWHIVGPHHLIHWSGNFWFEEVQSILWWCRSAIMLKCWSMADLANSKSRNYVQVPVLGQSACGGRRNQWHDLWSANTLHSFSGCPLYFIMEHGGGLTFHM